MNTISLMKTKHHPSRTLDVHHKEQNTTYLRPSCLVKKKEGSIQLAIALPGVPRDNLTVSLEKSILTVTGKRAPAGLHPPEDPLTIGTPEGYQLKTQLNHDLDSEAMSAHLENGVLTLVLPEKESVKRRKIPIH